jgi:predicted regulator of Ras-like GTPase activity (Roadblock/LC7/MglB family)
VDQPFAREITVEELVLAELRSLRDNVVSVHGSLVATSDGLLVTHDIPDMEPTRIAAIVAATLGLASQATGRGGFREAVARGGTGYLVVYAAGGNAVVAVLGDNELNVGMLHYEMRDMIVRITAYSAEFARWADPETFRRALNRDR